MSFGQIVNKNRVFKLINTSKDTLSLEQVAISPVQFTIQNKEGDTIPKENYYVNFKTGKLLYLTKAKQVKVSYFNYPSFLTKSYSPFNKKLIIAKATPNASTFSLKQKLRKSDFFGGLDTYGNITRGITVGNNQGSVLESGLDLQITGNLSDNLKLRASIKDSNLPIQENGISQNINEFDRVFIELFTNTWNLKAGDVDLSNNDSYFLNFTKKINGAKLDVVLDNGDQKTKITASGALARGKFNSQNISAKEGNQGPYRLLGANGEINIVVISGSETVYVNGITLKRGEQYDYTIDYNTSEIVFNPTFPINSTQRIIVDYQYSDQNYNRFVTHNGINYENEKFSFGTYFYNENDVKSQPIQQNLSNEQKLVLQQAGNDLEQMIAQSAQLASFDQNRIQYRKNELGNFVFTSTEESEAELYNVVFSFVGEGKGNYVLKESIAVGNIFEYISPENGELKGNYAPITQLFAPSKTQIAIIKTGYKIDENSFINAEVAYSDNDQNLFSEIDNKQNKGFASTLIWKQKIKMNTWDSYNLFEGDFVQKNFNNIEGLYNPEFNRDWNIDVNANPNTFGNQTFIRNSLSLQKNTSHKIAVNNSYLELANVFKGIKNGIDTYNAFKNVNVTTNTSYLKNESTTDKGSFTRHSSSLKYNFKKAWLQGVLKYEKSFNKNKANSVLDSINTQKQLLTGLNFGVGDSTNVYTKFAYQIGKIDSVRVNNLVRVQNTQNYEIESQWVKNKNTSLNTFANYRKVKNVFIDDIDVVNARAQYNQQLFNQILRLNTLYETSSGSTPQQNFSYIETEPGQGFYTYLGDLNNNNKRDFDEFEIAQFKDQANYLRVILPNRNRAATQKAKFSQSLFLNFNSFQNSKRLWLKILSHFSTLSSVLIDKDQLKQGKRFNVNPFQKKNEQVISLRQNVNTSLFFNRGIQKYSTTYIYQNSKNTQKMADDLQSTSQNKHELVFQHNIQDNWLINNTITYENNKNTSSNFDSRRFTLVSQKINPSISFFKDEFSTFETGYIYKQENNIIGEEYLLSHNFGFNYNYNSPKKGSVLTSINLIENKYTGSFNTPASYRILEGLEAGTNYTWSVIIQKKLTELLDLSINYNGRQSESTNTIHIGSVQLRANF